MMNKQQIISADLKKLETILGAPLWENIVPEGFVNNVNGWGFSEKEVTESKGQLLTLDIDFGTACSLNCLNCFKRDNKVIGREKKNLCQMII